MVYDICDCAFLIVFLVTNHLRHWPLSLLSFSLVRTLFSLFDWPIVCSLKIHYDSSLTLLKKLAYMVIVYSKALFVLIVCMKQIVIYVIIYVVTQWSEQYKLDQPSNPVLDLSDESSDQWILMSTSSWATGNGSKMTIDIQCYSLWILIEFDYISRAWIVIWGTPHISFVVNNVP